MKTINLKRKYGKVAVLMGGNSAEREISLLSGEAIYQELISSEIDAIKIDTLQNNRLDNEKQDLYQSLIHHKIDRVLIALHGRDGEDGVIQGFLRMLDIPFTGSDTASSALAMNKLNSKIIWRQKGLHTANFVGIGQDEKPTIQRAEAIFSNLGSPLFVKPIREGSSVGMSKVYNCQELIEAIEKAQQYDAVLVEQFINGQEYTVGILKTQTLPSINMVTPNEFYDYDAKYYASSTEYFCPSDLTPDEENNLSKMALKAFELLGCSGWGRVDFIRDAKTKKFILLEANTVPGMTATSLVPKAAKVMGLNYSELVIEILNTSFEGSEATIKVDLYHD